jgi:GT2 family glycosyltransferase
MSSKVSIIVPAYFTNDENQRYLDLCLKSIKAQTYTDYEVIVSSSGSMKPQVPEEFIHVHSDERLHFPKAVNQGTRRSDPTSKYLFILNDDTCLTETCLQSLVESVNDNLIVANPISNCDNFARYQLIIGIQKNGDFNPVPVRFLRYNQIEGDEDHFIKAKSIYPHGIINQNWLAIYATLIPRKAWEMVGEIDENFKTGQDDLDWCLRAKKLNIPNVVVLNSLAWHFGGVTSSIVIDQEMRQHNFKTFIEKWGMRPEQAGF